MRNTVWSACLGIILIMTGCSIMNPSTNRVEERNGQTAQSIEVTLTKQISANFWLYLPPSYGETSKEFPLMLFLHGAGERGADLEKVKTHGPPKLAGNMAELDHFVIVSPQCPTEGWWNADELKGLLDYIIETYRIDSTRVYCTGLSMGGYGTWALATAYPEMFAAIAPICGGGSRITPFRLKDMPIWAFHGAKDPTVPLSETQVIIDRIRKDGGNPKFTIYPEAQHDSWTESYANPELYQWLLEHRNESAALDPSEN